MEEQRALGTWELENSGKYVEMDTWKLSVTVNNFHEIGLSSSVKCEMLFPVLSFNQPSKMSGRITSWAAARTFRQTPVTLEMKSD